MNPRQFIAIFLCVASLAQAQSTAGVVEKPHGKFWMRWYEEATIPPAKFNNNNRIAGLIRAGKLYLTVQDAIARFANRWAALEGARERGHALAGAVGTERTVRDLLGWVGAELQPAAIEVRREGSSPVYTFQVGPAGASALLITQEVLAQHTSTDVIAALRAHRVPERLRAGGRTRLTCLSARGKIIVQPAE